MSPVSDHAATWRVVRDVLRRRKQKNSTLATLTAVQPVFL